MATSRNVNGAARAKKSPRTTTRGAASFAKGNARVRGTEAEKDAEIPPRDPGVLDSTGQSRDPEQSDPKDGSPLHVTLPKASAARSPAETARRRESKKKRRR